MEAFFAHAFMHCCKVGSELLVKAAWYDIVEIVLKMSVFFGMPKRKCLYCLYVCLSLCLSVH